MPRHRTEMVRESAISGRVPAENESFDYGVSGERTFFFMKPGMLF